ncbi:MAG: hypothetical protein HQL98_06165 [Magnetococcales bacterium]|nr:hypothetical protein [Magnetococcales bacterium]
MQPVARVIVVVDLHDHPQQVIRTALTLTRLHRAQLRFVALFDQGWIPDSGQLSSQDRFGCAAASMLGGLENAVAQAGAGEWPCSLLSGHPAKEMALLTAQWGATLILTDPATARDLHSGWFPWQHASTPLTCPIHVVEPPPPAFLVAITGLLRRFRWLRSSPPTANSTPPVVSRAEAPTPANPSQSHAARP